MQLKPYAIVSFILMLASCKSPQNTDSDSTNPDPEKTYVLKLSPANNSVYQYVIENESSITVETEKQEFENINKSEIGVTYTIRTDSNNYYRFDAVYSKLHFTSEQNGELTEIDAENGSFSINPLEKMLGMLKDSVISVTVTSTGELVNMSGYKRIGEQIIAGLSANDEAGKKEALDQWEKYIGEGLIKKNFEQLFRLFPDSAVRLGAKWKLTERESGELQYNLNGYYTLKAINQDLAIIGSESKISATGSTTVLSEMGGSITSLTGEQIAEYEMETKTGVVLGCRVKTSLEGMVRVMNKEVPVKAVVNVKVSGKKKQGN